jgi:hypothetical protein
MTYKWLPRTTDNGIDYLDLLVCDEDGWRLFSLPLWKLTLLAPKQLRSNEP